MRYRCNFVQLNRRLDTVCTMLYAFHAEPPSKVLDRSILYMLSLAKCRKLVGLLACFDSHRMHCLMSRVTHDQFMSRLRHDSRSQRYLQKLLS